jgi:hypothetical protein
VWLFIASVPSICRNVIEMFMRFLLGVVAALVGDGSTIVQAQPVTCAQHSRRIRGSGRPIDEK